MHPEDISDIIALLERLQSAQICLTSDLSDPRGTHRVCAGAIFAAVRRVARRGLHFEVWLYCGAWQEWQPHEIDRVVPLSPEDLERKQTATFRLPEFYARESCLRWRGDSLAADDSLPRNRNFTPAL